MLPLTYCRSCLATIPATDDCWQHIHLPGDTFCSREHVHAGLIDANLCIGCDGENVATGEDHWCDDCRAIAVVEVAEGVR